ncbi:hypothetical protein BH11MYX1_BH11MYX1_15960 [soil metagenome]
MHDDDVIYVDTRNADSRDHRTGNTSNGSRGPTTRPMTTVYVPGSSRSPVYAQQAPMYCPPPYTEQPSVAATLFGKLTTGQVVDMVAQLFAMLQTLPSAPVATRDAGTDVANLIMYQGALAQHAKRDEQVRTLGGLVGKVMG